MSFNSLGLSQALLKAISKKGYTTPSPIQQKAIPPVLAGKDVLASAQTGTGKTAGFTLPMLQILSQGQQMRKRPIRALVLTPTRELADQIYRNAKQIADQSDIAIDIRKYTGGSNREKEIQRLKKTQPSIIIGTPGKIIDLAIKENVLNIYKN
mgnify:CR=1 FL=1